MDDDNILINYIHNMNGKNFNIYDSKNIDVIENLKNNILSRLDKLDNVLLNLKGVALKKFISNTILNLNKIVQSLNIDDNASVNNLVLITDITMFIWVLNDMLSFVNTFKDCNFRQLLNLYKNSKKRKNDVNHNTRSKKRKLNNCSSSNDDDDDYEPDDTLEGSDDGLEDDTLEGHDDELFYLPQNDTNKFIQEIFKGHNQMGVTNEITNYFGKLNNSQKKESLANIQKITNYQSDNKPMIFRIMELPLDISQKNHIIKQYTHILKSKSPEQKLNSWFDALMSIPFGKYCKGVNNNTKNPNKFLNNLTKTMDSAVYGHDEAKRQIIQIMGQQIRNPSCKGNVIGLYGVPGCGKTSLIKDGIAKALDRPFVFISLGGATDASFLEGHSYTYEGSVYGRIVNGLISSKCMNPIFYFDELDKISKSHKGDEIANILVHLTDPIQNSHFRDKYFHGIDIDLSKAMFIFSFNDPSNINPILLDRITLVETKYLLSSQKLFISKNYLLPEILKEMGLDKSSISIPDDVVEHLIETYTNEGGVRKLKELLYNIVREINLANILKTKVNNSVPTYPLVLEKEQIKHFLKYKLERTQDKIHPTPQVGVINGLFASSNGCGGILPIQVVWIPSGGPLKMKATGNLRKVIKESVEVATSLAWNHLDETLKNKYLLEFKKRPQGFHLHCPEGAVPKDGPSAGTALTVVLYSILTGKEIRNDIAITGEINLKGQVTAIGGLEEKLQGAKKAGVKLVLFPKENIKNLEKVKERNPTLLDDDFEAIPIETIEEALSYSLV
jgi:endopeptidase La